MEKIACPCCKGRNHHLRTTLESELSLGLLKRQSSNENDQAYQSGMESLHPSREAWKDPSVARRARTRCSGAESWLPNGGFGRSPPSHQASSTGFVYLQRCHPWLTECCGQAPCYHPRTASGLSLTRRSPARSWRRCSSCGASGN